MYNFDKGVKRIGTNCSKWDELFLKEGRDDLTPMWVADMDFEVAPAITENLKRVASQGAFGYQYLSEQYYQVIMDWMRTRHDYEVRREEIVYLPNVVSGLRFAVEAVSEPGDEILIPAPVYGPFFKVVSQTGRKIVTTRMNNDNGYYTMDLEDLERKITDKTKAVLFCNPHNPSGRVWNRDELEAFAAVCLKHNIYMISDDIHCELVMKGHKHTFLASLSREAAEKTLTFTSPSKAFNLASIHVANVFITDEVLREKVRTLAAQSFCGECNAFAEAALVGAYGHSGEWLDELISYIEGNIDYFVNDIRENIPQLTVYKPEGTYLVWVDIHNVKPAGTDGRSFLIEKCRTVVNDGTFFGEEGEGFVRFNLACPRSFLLPVLERMKEAFQ